MQNEKQIFPKEIIENSVEKHFADYNPRNRVVYLSLLGLFAFAFLLLFIIRLDVTVRTMGMIRSVQERTDIRAPVNGVIDSVYITENQHVQAGQPLIKIHSQSVDEKAVAITTQNQELQAQFNDLRLLLSGSDSALQSQLYQQQNLLYKQRLSDAQLKLDLASRAYSRFSGLYRSRAISAAEFDKYDYDYKNAQNELRIAREQQRSQWQGDLSRLEVQLKQVGAQQTAYQEEKDLYTIRASVTGTVQKLKSVAPGTFVTPSENVGEVSPDSGLIVEAYVPTKDVGMIRKDAQVKLQVDAYDYNYWGALKGKVMSISEDVFTDKGMPYFRVLCSIDRTVMKMRNGTEGALKKGMTVNARFIVTRRSLYHLLFDNVNDWLNPNNTKTSTATASVNNDKGKDQ